MRIFDSVLDGPKEQSVSARTARQMREKRP